MYQINKIIIHVFCRGSLPSKPLYLFGLSLALVSGEVVEVEVVVEIVEAHLGLGAWGGTHWRWVVLFLNVVCSQYGVSDLLWIVEGLKDHKDLHLQFLMILEGMSIADMELQVGFISWR